MCIRSTGDGVLLYFSAPSGGGSLSVGVLNRALKRHRRQVATYFGFLANIVTQSYPASNLVTRRALGWEPAQPSLLADLDNGYYFPAG
ncbi:hypothetical protein AB0E69_15010 [Kribbella sp. NPDC026611]|uniref:hypothetical protein n=1 Tax=Kribbella sp. NPDC026611 TaxID=3154911 RepID=UPI0033EC68BC